MAESNLDKGMGFSGVGRAANPLKPRTLHPGGTEKEEEPVVLKSIDQSRSKGLNENAEPGAIHGHDPERTLPQGDLLYTVPKDASGTTTPILASDPSYEWGRNAQDSTLFRGGRCDWEEFAKNPGYGQEKASAQKEQKV
jgi:hypothetical protein